jgi:hypothetical protein
VADGAAWDPPVPPPLRDRARAAACLIAERLERPEVVRASAEAMRHQQRAPAPAGAPCPYGLSWIAELFLCLTLEVDRAYEEPAHRYLRLAAQASQELPVIRPALHGGTAGLVLVLESFFRQQPAYRRTRAALHQRLAEQVRARAWRRPEPGVAADDYDLISGAAGILGCLVSLEEPGAGVEQAIGELLGYLVWLAGEDQRGRERWFVPPQFFHHEERHGWSPDGYVDLGLAHGIPGPLAALALAWQAGYRVGGQREAMERLIGWLLDRRLPDPWGPHWPSDLPVDTVLPPEGQEEHHERPAWCYGDPGVAAALWLAGSALDDERLRRTALASLEGVFRRPSAVDLLFSPTLCHGAGGLLAVSLRLVGSTPSEELRHEVPALLTRILDACRPDLLLGVQDQELPGNFVDDHTFLTGAAGVALLLLAASASTPPRWFRALLIA